MASNPLTAPSGPSPWGAPGGNVVPRGTPMMRNALAIPRVPPPPPPMPAAPAAPVSGEIEPGLQDHISQRVPVPKADFPQEHHKDLHEKTMGAEFDQPHAADWVRQVYPIVRRANPHVDPRHVLEATRDAYYAAKHGFATHYQAGHMVGRIARGRHAAEEARRLPPPRVVLPVT